MTGDEPRTTVGPLPKPTPTDSWLPAALTRATWLLWVLSVGALAVHLWSGATWTVAGRLRVDGLTVVLWVAVTFFSGIVHSYSRRYMAGNGGVDRFFARVFAFTLTVMVLVAADGLLVFGAAWLAMGLVMAGLIGHAREWSQARAAASHARRYFLASSALLGVALATLWWTTGATTVSGVASSVGAAPSSALLVAAAALLLAAMVQSALLPFHTWLLSSMTAPTPASALMHAGFVNAGGVLLVRFAPVVTADRGVMLAIVLAGAASALGGKLLKTVQSDVKSTLACSTVGQMGFMIMQAGLGFFAAAITHLVLHGFYKAYRFLASGGAVSREHPATAAGAATGLPSPLGAVVVGLTALAGGGVFALLTGEGTDLGGGLVLVGLVVLTVLHAAREALAHTDAPAAVRYGAVPLVALPALAAYAAVYRAVAGLLAGLPGVGHPVGLTPVHAAVALAFLATYLAVESGVYRRSRRLYVALVNATRPPTDTLLTTTEDYHEH
ncbi:MAG: proton-conducting transporter membrane subunit [Halobacteriaceae archaeon]